MAKQRVPGVLLIDSTALFQLGPRFERADFQKLLEFRNILKFEIAIPYVAYQEYLRERKGELRESLTRLEHSKTLFGKIDIDCEQMDAIRGAGNQRLAKIEEYYNGKLEALGIRIVPTPKVDIERLILMSIDCTPPFEKSHEKGFRDSLVMFAMLESIKGRPDLASLAITNDDLLADGLRNHAKEYGTEIDVTPNFAGAVEIINGCIDEAYRKRLREEATAARELLLQHVPEIEEKLAAIKSLSYFEIAASGLKNIDRVVSLKFKDVESAIWETRTEQESRLLFSAKCEVTVITRPMNWSFLNPQYAIGSGSSLIFGEPEPQPSGETGDVTYFGAAVFVKQAGREVLTDLRIDRSLSTAALGRLARAALSDQ